MLLALILVIFAPFVYSVPSLETPNLLPIAKAKLLLDAPLIVAVEFPLAFNIYPPEDPRVPCLIALLSICQPLEELLPK